MLYNHSPLFDPAADPAATDPNTGGGAAPGVADVPWHQSVIAKGSDGAESLADFASWKDKAPAPLVKFITDNMTAARAKAAPMEGMIKVPGESATPEERAAFYKALGVPDDVEGYELKAPEKIPDGVHFDEARAKEFTVFAKEHGLTKAQVIALQDFQVEYVGKQVAAAREQHAVAMAAETAELSKRFPNISSTLETVKSLENRNGVPESIKAVIKGGGFDPQNPDFWGADALEFVAWAAKATGEDRGAGGAGMPAAASARAESLDIMNNPANPLHKAFHKGDPVAVAKVAEGYK